MSSGPCPWVENDDLELARIYGNLVCPAQVVHARARDEKEGLTLAVHLIVEAGAVGIGEARFYRYEPFSKGHEAGHGCKPRGRRLATSAGGSQEQGGGGEQGESYSCYAKSLHI